MNWQSVFRGFGVRAGMIAAALSLLVLVPAASAQQPAGKPAPKGMAGFGGFMTSNDPRVQNRTYHFADTDEDLPYCVFVSSKVSKDKPAPLIVSLHGMGVGPGFACQGKVVDLAEEGGYILVGPMGYNVSGWYGSPVISFGANAKPGAKPGPKPGAAPDAQAKPAMPPMPPMPEPPANLAELSEKDVLNVFGMVRKEFNVDPDRTYLMGHSMGGAGTLFLGSKHASEWAALAAIAPAAFMMNNDRAAILKAIKAPVFIAQGDDDQLVPASNTQLWVDTMKELKLDGEYKLLVGADHGSVIDLAMPGIFDFFGKHTRKK